MLDQGHDGRAEGPEPDAVDRLEAVTSRADSSCSRCSRCGRASRPRVGSRGSTTCAPASRGSGRDVDEPVVVEEPVDLAEGRVGVHDVLDHVEQQYLVEPDGRRGLLMSEPRLSDARMTSAIWSRSPPSGEPARTDERPILKKCSARPSSRRPDGCEPELGLGAKELSVASLRRLLPARRRHDRDPPRAPRPPRHRPDHAGRRVTCRRSTRPTAGFRGVRPRTRVRSPDEFTHGPARSPSYLTFVH